MHRTESLDYGVVLSGQVRLRLDDEEVVLDPGDVVVQRGTVHAWGNTGAEPAVMLFVLIDGLFDGSLRTSLGEAADDLMVEPPR